MTIGPTTLISLFSASIQRFTTKVTRKASAFRKTMKAPHVIYLHTGITHVGLYDNVIKWKLFRVTGLLCGEFTGPGEFTAQRPVTRIFDVFSDLRQNIRLSKQPRGWWFETPSWSLWRQCNEKITLLVFKIGYTPNGAKSHTSGKYKS